MFPNLPNDILGVIAGFQPLSHLSKKCHESKQIFVNEREAFEQKLPSLLTFGSNFEEDLFNYIEYMFDFMIAGKYINLFCDVFKEYVLNTTDFNYEEIDHESLIKKIQLINYNNWYTTSIQECVDFLIPLYNKKRCHIFAFVINYNRVGESNDIIISYGQSLLNLAKKVKYNDIFFQAFKDFVEFHRMDFLNFEEIVKQFELLREKQEIKQEIKQKVNEKQEIKIDEEKLTSVYSQVLSRAFYFNEYCQGSYELGEGILKYILPFYNLELTLDPYADSDELEYLLERAQSTHDEKIKNLLKIALKKYDKHPEKYKGTDFTLPDNF